jgi:hypothetical protein
MKGIQQKTLNKSYTTHMPTVIKVVQATTGPVIEFGGGLCSTPLLHWLCAEDRRKLISFEDNPEYYQYMKVFQSRTHRIRLVNNWDDIKVNGHYSVILIDHITERRAIDAIKWKDNADYIILHDTESKNEVYHYNEVYPHFKYVYHWKFSWPWTSVVSNFKDLSFLEKNQ